MKNFTKLLMVVVLLASYSCVQDATEDLAPVISGPNGGSGEVKTLQASMPAPATRTGLGDRYEDAEGKIKYPVYWCEEDVLAVNGKPTTGISIYEDKPNVAVFELPLGITMPFHVVYPYQGADVSVEANSGKYPVVFSVEQKHTEGTFAPNSAPMYGWTTGFDDIEMKHLAAALRFSIKAKEGQVDLKYISVSTVDAAPIAGVFDVFCAEKDGVEAGTLEPRKNTYSTVFYNFEGDSYLLSADKEDTFYIVVPKGEYSRFEVNFVEQSGKVYSRTFDAVGDKQLLGGTVREFPPVVFDTEKCDNMLLIGTDADMETFASEVKAGTFNTKYDGALLVSDIDMTGKPWVSLEGFDSLLEGRGHAIKGLTTPLFGENIVGTISNVNVEGNLVEEANGKVGLVARSLAVAGDKVGTIFNCSAVGSIEYKNTAIAVNNDYKLINIGGVVGGVYGGKVSLAESEVEVTIATIAGDDGKTTEFTPCIGGVVGYACAEGENLPELVENTNNGAIIWVDGSESAKVAPYIGGVAGYVVAGSFESNVNAGALVIEKSMGILDWGGVIGASNVSVVNCENKGSLTINQQITKANIGGVLGKLEAGSALNCENSGTLLFDTEFYINENCNIGGVIAYANEGTKEINNCSNSGTITYLGECKWEARDNRTNNASIVLGGVLGTVWSETVKDCCNLEAAKVVVGGKVAGNGDRNAGTALEKTTSIAGVIGVRAGRQSDLRTATLVYTENCSNQGNVSFAWQYCGNAYIFSAACVGVFDSDEVKSCKNEGRLSVQVDVTNDLKTHETTSLTLVYVSGLFGCIRSSCDKIENCVNTGDIEVANSNAQSLYVSGLIGTTIQNVQIELSSCANEGDILVGEDVYVRSLYVGGILAGTSGIKIRYADCYNSGTVETRATSYGQTYLGSIFGFATGSDTGAGTTGVSNSGKVIYAGKSAIVYVGGYCGCYQENNHTVQFENSSNGSVEYKGEASLCAFVGGIAGLGGGARVTFDKQSNSVASASWTQITGGAFKGMTNKGNVTIDVNSYAPEVYVAGCFGYLTAKDNGVSNLNNEGTVEVPDMSEAKKYPESIYMGGVFGHATMNTAYPTSANSITIEKAISNCHNKGNIIYKGIARDGVFVGGVAGLSKQAALYGCTNEGEITSEGHAGDSSPRREPDVEMEGITYDDNMKNHDIAIGGIVGETDFDISGCTNSGAVTHTCRLNPLRKDYKGELATSRFDVGGIAGRVFTPKENTTAYICSFGNLTNEGKITILGTPSATNNFPTNTNLTSNEFDWRVVYGGSSGDVHRQNRRLYNRVNVAGLIGRMMDLSPTVTVTYQLSGSTNTEKGAVTVPNAGGAKCLSVAGGIADILVSKLECTTVSNAGRIAVENAGVGSEIDTKFQKSIGSFFINLGGIAATHFDHRIFNNSTALSPTHTATFTNCENSGAIHYGETGASVYQCAGGILAQALHSKVDRDAGSTYTSDLSLTFSNCKNSGNIDYVSNVMTATYNHNYAGGILGTGNTGHLEKGAAWPQLYGYIDVVFDHCENSASIQWDRSNGVRSTNTYPEYTAVGGIVGHYTGGRGHKSINLRDDGYAAEIKSCKNTGRIYGLSGCMGGIVGLGCWFVKITGTEAEPTINTGDIAVKRENGNVIINGIYGNKSIYAGGIAGKLEEVKYTSSSYIGVYNPEHQYCRVEYAVNEGAVGATGQAGGVAGFYWSAVVPSKREGVDASAHRGGIQGCRNTGSIYSLEQTGKVGSIVGMERISVAYYNNGTPSGKEDLMTYLLEGINDAKQWPVGVLDCYVGGSLHRQGKEMKIDESNYMDAIYGGSWDSTFPSISTKGDYDGCELYVSSSNE